MVNHSEHQLAENAVHFENRIMLLPEGGTYQWIRKGHIYTHQQGKLVASTLQGYIDLCLIVPKQFALDHVEFPDALHEHNYYEVLQTMVWSQWSDEMLAYDINTYGEPEPEPEPRLFDINDPTFIANTNAEIQRLVKLQASTREEHRVKNMSFGILASVVTPEPEQEIRMKEWNDYYEAAEKFVAQKLRFWGQAKNGVLDADMLDKLQEYMDEFLTNSRKVFGMEDFKTHDKQAIEEFNMFKGFVNCNPKKAKKATRRGGKKNKKKNPSGAAAEPETEAEDEHESEP